MVDFVDALDSFPFPWEICLLSNLAGSLEATAAAPVLKNSRSVEVISCKIILWICTTVIIARR